MQHLTVEHVFVAFFIMYLFNLLSCVPARIKDSVNIAAIILAIVLWIFNLGG